MSDAAAIDRLQSLMAASTAPRNARWRDRYNEIPRAVSSAREKYRPAETPKASEGEWRYYNGEPSLPPPWLIKNVLPETGTALISGQWGTYKTTVAIEIAVSVMTGLAFAGRYRVKRRGGVLFIALEGGGGLSARLQAIATHHGVEGALPLAWREDCPALTDDEAIQLLCGLVEEARADVEKQFNLPIVLIVIDTLITAAQHKEGGDNDTAASQKVMQVMRRLSTRTGALVVGIDHFGKVIETGTRGSSAKEAAVDTVLALLADRALNGTVTNTRIAVRKQRDGISGLEIPFSVRIIQKGIDEDGDPETAQVIDWQASLQNPAAGSDPRWTKSMKLLRRVLMSVLAEHGFNARPFADRPEVRACDIELVRAEFHQQHHADGTPEQKNESRRKAFKRAVDTSKERNVIATREVNGVQLIWLDKPEREKTS
jgi:AAA domain